MQDKDQPSSDPFRLTEREMEMLKLLVEGLTNNQSASQLHLSGSTVGNHAASISCKLGVNDRLQTLRQVFEYCLVEVSSRLPEW